MWSLHSFELVRAARKRYVLDVKNVKTYSAARDRRRLQKFHPYIQAHIAHQYWHLYSPRRYHTGIRSRNKHSLARLDCKG